MMKVLFYIKLGKFYYWFSVLKLIRDVLIFFKKRIKCRIYRKIYWFIDGR